MCLRATEGAQGLLIHAPNQGQSTSEGQDPGLYRATPVRYHSEMVSCLLLQWLKNKQVMDLASLSFSPEGHCAHNPYSPEHGTLSFRPDYTD